MRKARWGVLGTGRIGVDKVIPAMQGGELCEVVAVASRSLDRARAAASRLGIPKAYGSYQELLADPEVEVVYNPLPNLLHVPWSIRALEAGKHVLCEKPVAVSAAEAQSLLDAARNHPQLKVMEAFMYRHHPQWPRARQLVQDGQIGRLHAIQSTFTFALDDDSDIRNSAECAGGALMDVGCYCISQSRLMFGAEPLRVLGVIDLDPESQVDRAASGILDFGHGIATFTCSIRLAHYQRAVMLGTEGRVELENPFSVDPDQPIRMWHYRGRESEEIVFDACDHYMLECDRFSRAVLEDIDVLTPLEDAVANMRVIDALKLSAERGDWV